MQLNLKDEIDMCSIRQQGCHSQPAHTRFPKQEFNLEAEISIQLFEMTHQGKRTKHSGFSR